MVTSRAAATVLFRRSIEQVGVAGWQCRLGQAHGCLWAAGGAPVRPPAHSTARYTVERVTVNNSSTSFGGVYPGLRDYDHTDWQNAAVGQEGTNGSMQSLGTFSPTSVSMTSTRPSGPQLAHVDGGQVTGDSFHQPT